ncbi:cadherin-related family member 3 [Pelodytes ibericus]
MEKLILLYFLLGVIGPGGGTVSFVRLPNTTTVLENQPAGTNVFTFSLTSTSTIAAAFPFIINTSPLTQAFKITYASPIYNVVTTGSPVLDFETTPNSFDLQIYVEDMTGATDLQILTVQLSNVNEPPFFLDNLASQDVTVYITEGVPASGIYTIQASDPESPANTLMYSLSPGSFPFSVSASGTISSTKVFDYETGPNSYTLTVKVMDPQGLSVNGTIIINLRNINDETPYFTTTTRTYYIKEEQMSGMTVANINAVDPDGFPLLYSISATKYFTINEVTGEIKIAMTIDREASPLRLNPVIDLTVTVNDSPTNGQTNSTNISFVIQDINDNPPTCTQYAFSISVSETQSNGTLMIDLTGFCSDIDVDAPYNQFNFTGLTGLGSNDKFQLIPSGTGKIVLNGNLDYEDPNNIALGNEYILTVVVQDIAAPYYKKYLYVYVKTTPVNEFPPVFANSLYVFNVSELSPPSTKIGQVFATDKDYPYNRLTYSIVAAGSSNLFWIDSVTGDLHLATYADYELTKKYIFTVQATDAGSLFSTASVTVNILEANDEKPICLPNEYKLTVPVDQAIGTNIQNFKLTCTDRDSSPNSFQYFINSGNINNHFDFSPDAGSNITSLVLAIPFDYTGGSDTVWNYKLVIYITDGNLGLTGLVQTGTVTLYVNVYIPGLTTITTTTTPEIIYISKSENAYSAAAWYIPFVITLGCVLLLGLLGYLIYLLAKHCPCKIRSKPDKEPLITPTENKKIKHDVFWEMTKINTVFDGEAQDPITGKMYEYNSKSGARRWKDSQQPIESGQSLTQLAGIESEPPAPSSKKDERVMSRGNANKKEKTPSNAAKGAEDTNTPKPATSNRLQTPNQQSTKPEMGKESPIKRTHSPLSPRSSPKVAPKTPI